MDKTELAFKCMWGQIIFLVIGLFIVGMTDRWASLSIFFMFLVSSIVISLITLVIGVLAIKSGEENKEKATLAIGIALIFPILFIASAGSIAF